MNYLDGFPYGKWPFPLTTDPGWVPEPHVDGFQYPSFPNVRLRHHQMPSSYMRGDTVQGQFPDDIGFVSVRCVDVASGSAIYAQTRLHTPTTPVGMYRHPQEHNTPLHYQENLRLRFDTLQAAQSAPAPMWGKVCHAEGVTMISTPPELQTSPWRLAAEAKAVQQTTNIYNNGRNGNHLPIAHPFAEAIQVPVAGPDTSLPEALPAPFVEAQVREDNESSRRRGEKAWTKRGKLHGEGLHICTVDGKVFRHRGDLVRHWKTKPGHAEYQGPFICVCRQEFSRRDGLYTHLKSKRCRRPLFSSK